MKNPLSIMKSRFTDIPIHRRYKYGILSCLAIVTLVVVTVIAAIDVKEEEIITAEDPIESYDKVTVIPLVLEDEETEEDYFEDEWESEWDDNTESEADSVTE
ncbi:MAG: hypothetical protein IKM46_04435 [Clostridia bacterium]|nr:hypothetical protein [Clostridia bacterium]